MVRQTASLSNTVLGLAPKLQYAGLVTGAEKRRENVVCMRDMASDMRKNWVLKNARGGPTRVIIFRDGVSNKQYISVRFRRVYFSFVDMCCDYGRSTRRISKLGMVGMVKYSTVTQNSY